MPALGSRGDTSSASTSAFSSAPVFSVVPPSRHEITARSALRTIGRSLFVASSRARAAVAADSMGTTGGTDAGAVGVVLEPPALVDGDVA